MSSAALPAIQPGDDVIRMTPVPREPRRERSGLEQYATYRVDKVQGGGEILRLVGIAKPQPRSAYELVPADPCA